MCLTLPLFALPRLAFRDIECYKHLERDSQIKDMYRTSYQLTVVDIGETYKAKIRRDGHHIHEGLHSFIHLEDAEFDMTRFHSSTRMILCKCIIPKWSWYYKGHFRYFTKADSYVSNRLKYVEIISIE